MPCNMAARGDSLGIVAADGEKRLRELLEEALSRVPSRGPGKVAGILEIAGGACEVHLLLDEGGLVAACLDCTGKGTLRGKRAVEELESLLSESPRTGYLEPMRLERDALELDLELEPEARLPEPLPAKAILEERAEAPEAGPRETPSAPKEPPKEQQAGEEAAEPRPPPPPPPVSAEKLEQPATMDAAELASMLVYLLDRSRVVLHAHGLKRLLLEAREASGRDREAFYRAVVEVKDDGIFNAFYYGGRLCSVVYLDPGAFQAQFLRGLDEESLTERIKEAAGDKGIELMLLYRVDCPDCAKVFLADCFTDQEKKEAREGKRGGLLARLFGRRK